MIRLFDRIRLWRNLLLELRELHEVSLANTDKGRRVNPLLSMIFAAKPMKALVMLYSP